MALAERGATEGDFPERSFMAMTGRSANARRCTKCVIESSLAYSLNPGLLIEKARYL
jgi:hypothetical protein